MEKVTNNSNSNSSNAVERASPRELQPGAGRKRAKGQAEESGLSGADGFTSVMLSAESNAKQGLQAAGAEPRSPKTQVATASLDTGVAISGLKPWSKGWVFHGADELSPETKPLIPSGLDKLALTEDSLTPEQMGQLLKAGDVDPQLRAALEAARRDSAAQAGEGAETSAPQATQAFAASQQVSGEMGVQTRIGTAGIAEPGARPIKVGGLVEKADSLPMGQLGGAEYLATLQTVQAGAGASGQRSGGDAMNPQKGSHAEVQSVGRKQREAQGLEDLRLDTAMASGVTGTTAGATGGGERIEVSANVVQGAGAQNRLSTDGLVNVSQGVLRLASNGGGEIRLRLKPDHLGELHVRVTDRGGQLGLQIHASDERSKRILESSLSHLRESLAGQNLSVGRIDVALASSNLGSQMGDPSRQDGGSSQHQAMNGGQNPFGGQQSGFGRSNSERWQSGPSESGPMAGLATRRAVGAGGAGLSGVSGGMARGNQRLDVRI